jgi:hypothetical protein
MRLKDARMIELSGKVFICAAAVLWIVYIFGWLRSKVPFFVAACAGIIAMFSAGSLSPYLPTLPHFTFQVEHPDLTPVKYPLAGPTEEVCESMPDVIKYMRSDPGLAETIVAGVECLDILQSKHDISTEDSKQDMLNHGSWGSATQREWNLCAARVAEYFKNNCGFLYTKEHKANIRDAHKWIFSKDYKQD